MQEVLLVCWTTFISQSTSEKKYHLSDRVGPAVWHNAMYKFAIVWLTLHILVQLQHISKAVGNSQQFGQHLRKRKCG